MDLKKELLEKIPDYLKKEAEFKALLDYLKKEGIEERGELRDYLSKEIKEAEEWLLTNKRKGGTMVKLLRDKAVSLNVLKKSEKIVKQFLF